tara:strand:- start:303 stop:593 length:291 start_codon:yes stop_codon:yes gene_type:complete
MAITSPEHDYGQMMQDWATDLIALVNQCPDLDDIWTDGMDVALSDEDVSSLNITAAEVTAGVVLSRELAKLANGTSVSTGVEGDYRKTLNDLRKIS